MCVCYAHSQKIPRVHVSLARAGVNKCRTRRRREDEEKRLGLMLPFVGIRKGGGSSRWLLREKWEPAIGNAVAINETVMDRSLLACQSSTLNNISFCMNIHNCYQVKSLQVQSEVHIVQRKKHLFSSKIRWEICYTKMHEKGKDPWDWVCSATTTPLFAKCFHNGAH